MKVRITSAVARDFGLAIGIVIVACIAELAILAGSGGLFAGLFLAGARGAMMVIVFALPVGALAVTLAVGLTRRRIGLVIGAISFVAGLLLFSAGLSYHKARAAREGAEQARALDQRVLSPLEARHTVVAVDGEGGCGSICMQILAQTDYAFAAKGPYANEWAVFRRIEGEACQAPEHAQSYVRFLTAGYVGLCANKSRWSLANDAILVVAADNDHRRAEAMVGPLFRGNVFEAFERRNGRDRLLGRWLSGIIRHGKSREQIGASFEAEEFFSALLGVPLRHAEKSGSASLDELLTALTPYIESKGLNRDAAYAYSAFAMQAEKAEYPIVRRHVRSLLDSGRGPRISCGLFVIGRLMHWSEAELDFARDPIVAALESDDLEIVREGLYALTAFKTPARSFAQRAAELATERLHGSESGQE